MIVPTYVDVLLILLVLLGGLFGWRRGFLLGLLDLLTWAGSVALALLLYAPVAAWLGRFLTWPEEWAVPLAFILVATLSGVLITLLGALLLGRVPKELHRRRANRLLGILPGLVNGLVIAAVVSALLLTLPLPRSVKIAARESPIASRLVSSVERFEAAVRPVFGDAVARTLNLLTIQPESSERIDLPFSVDQPEPRPDLETEMLERLNQERAEAGLGPLAWDPALAEVARAHSADMFARGYFSHVTPEGFDPFDRMLSAGVVFVVAGENIALAPSLDLAHEGLMDSPGHRANILRPEFGRVGIGILDGGIHGLMVTQNFRD